ncbi:transglycosylase SLT domain-containing protein [Streptomyces sp. NPDC051362]|uniref:transglycosylase SLT domain-containing protein n=1 Tax=Streptomyces sp. NPDC051362 TaxID=3365651 RepID=UPI003792E19C
MAGDLDIVGGAAVDVVPIAPQFHTKLKAIVLPIADRVGEEAGRKMGEAISRNITIAIPDAITAGGRAARASAVREGGQIGGSLAQSIKRKLELAFRSLPRADVRLGDTGFNADLDRLRAKIQTLSGKTVGLDIDAGTALAEIAAIDTELQRLGAQHPDVNVRADTTRARAALAAIRAEVDAVDGQSATVKVKADTANAQGALIALAAQIGIVAALPVVPIAAAGIGAIASAAVAAGAGVGALALAAVPALKNVTSAIQAKSAADKEATSTTSNAIASNMKAAQSALQQASAQQALASAHRNAARAIAQANRQVEDAERAVAQATQRAADQRRQSAESVERAERSLADAQRSARQAERDLTQARADAAKQLDDLNDKLADGALNQRDAALRVQEAADELARVQASNDAGLASDGDLARAQLSYDQAVQAQKEQSKSYTQLQKDAAAAQKAGVDGNEAVKSAAQQLADAQRDVADQTRAVADAQRDAARAQIDATQAVADAQQGVADAVSNAADAQVQAAESIASAERGVESARLSGVDTTAKAATKADDYRKALAKLTPVQRDLYNALAGPTGLTSAFKAWSKELQPDVLPLFTRGVNGAKASLPGLTPLVKSSADAVGELMARAGAELKTPFWKEFKKDIAQSAKPAIVGLGVAFGNTFKGIAGIVDAFLPHMDGISRTMQRITQRFALWARNLKGSPEFEGFLKYVKDTAPQVGEVIGKAADALLSFSKAIAPTATVAYAIVGPLLDGVTWLSTEMPGLVQTLWGLYAVTKVIAVATRAWAIAEGLYSTAMAIATVETWSFAAALAATGWTEIVALVTAIAVAIAALVAGIIWAYKNVGWFHTAVDAAWTGIKVASLFLWEQVLKPTFDAIVVAVKVIGDVCVWLWKNAISPAWTGISLVLRVVAAIILTAVIAPLIIAFKLMGMWVGWLWKDIFKPAFEDIGAVAVWLWKNALKPTFQGIWDLLKWLGDKIAWLYQHIAKPYFQGIGSVATALYKNGLKPTFSAIWDLLKWIGGKFAWLYDKGVKPQLEAISITAKWLYEKGLKPAFDKIKSAIGLVSDAFRGARDSIKGVWGSVAGIAAKPVNFVIDAVYTHGIKAVWDKVADFVGLDSLPKAPRLLDETPRFANGGRTRGGTPGVDSIPILAMADEYIIRRDSARKIGFDNLAYMNATGEIPGTQRFANGGIVGSLGSAWDWTKDAVGGALSKGFDWASTAANLVAHPSQIWAKLMKPILADANKHLGVADMGKVLAKLPVKMVAGLRDQIIDAVTSGGGAAGGFEGVIPTGHRKQIIMDAMKATHIPPPGSVVQWLQGMNTLITRESGWNPNAINLWDSNAAAGHPSQGLTQTIPGTFNAYVPASLRSRGILDPVANVAASMRYIKSVYGNITNVQQANAALPPKGYADGGRVIPHWYDDGGYLPEGLSLVANGTGRPEPVFTGTQWDDIKASRGAPNIVVNVDAKTVLDGQELRGMVTEQINAYDADTGRAINTGRWV